MKRFATHGVTFIVAALLGMAIGFFSAWRMCEPERIAWKQSHEFRVAASKQISAADELVEKLCDIVASLENGLGASISASLDEE